MQKERNFCKKILSYWLYAAQILTSFTRATLSELETDLQLESIKTASVDHRTLAYGLVVRHKDGWSLTFVKSVLIKNNTNK